MPDSNAYDGTMTTLNTIQANRVAPNLSDTANLDKIGRYEIKRMIGQGAMGMVFLYRWRK